MSKFLMVLCVVLGVLMVLDRGTLGQEAIDLPVSESDGIIYFPDESAMPLHAATTPAPPSVLKTQIQPECATNQGDPCIDDLEYTEDVRNYVAHLLQRDKMVNALVSDPVLNDILIDSPLPSPVERPTIRFGPSLSESPVCAAQETLIRPQRAKNPKSEWVFVVNQPNVEQVIKVEKCIREGSQCEMGMKLPDNGPQTVCRQKYVYRRLLTISTNKLEPAEVLMPSCCVCYTSGSSDFDISSRVRNFTFEGSSPAANQPPAAPAPMPAINPSFAPTPVNTPAQPNRRGTNNHQGLNNAVFHHVGVPQSARNNRRTITHRVNPYPTIFQFQ